MSHGKYIVIEGSDGTGKTTQINLLKSYLEQSGKNVHITSEPADPEDAGEALPIARELRRLLKNGDIDRTPETNLLLFTAARVEKWRSDISPALARGDYVLSSRNYWSTLAYQGYGEGLDTRLIIDQTRLYLGNTTYMTPDFSVIILVENEAERQKRVKTRGLHGQKDTFETKDQRFQSRVANGYQTIAKEFNIPTIDGIGTPKEVSERLITALDLPR